MKEAADDEFRDKALPEPSPVLAPGLYLVATPIGNLEDITLRALRTLRSVDKIACEDTRQTQKLLNRFEIRKPTVSYHLHNEQGRAETLVGELLQGARIAVVSDAGTPGIADPGEAIVQAAVRAGVSVFPVPGASAAVSALTASGLSTERYSFHGFLPARSGQRKTFFESLRARMKADAAAGNGSTQVFYEAPHRILESLHDLAGVFGEAHPIVLARELTKLHEEFLRGPVSECAAQLAQRDAVRGELVLLLSGEFPSADEQSGIALTIAQQVAAAMKAGAEEKEALKLVARARGIGKSEVFREWQRSRR